MACARCQSDATPNSRACSASQACVVASWTTTGGAATAADRLHERFGYWSKTLSAGLFMLFATLFNIARLSWRRQRMKLSEYLLMNSVAGVAHAPRD